MSHLPMHYHQADITHATAQGEGCIHCDATATAENSNGEAVCEAHYLICETCIKGDGPQRPWTCEGPDGGPRLCDDHMTQMCEAQAERDYAAFHGGSAPFNDAERGR